LWHFWYRVAGTGHASGYYGDILAAAIEIQGTNNGNNMEINPGNGPTYIGSAPTSNNSTNYSSTINAVISFAITALGSMGASFLWTAASLILALGNNVNNSITEDDHLWRLWNWSPAIKDTGQFFWFFVDVQPNQTVEFSHEYMLFGPTYELLSAGKGYRTLYAGSPGNNTSSMNPELMTLSEREQYGIETISRENLLTMAAELGISEITLNEWLESSEDVFYYAHNFVEYETPQPEKTELSRSTLTKDMLLNELSEQIERSEKIIRAFSTDEICDLEDSMEIVQKHTARLAYLSELQTVAESTLRTDISGLNSVFEDYCEIADV
jgi:hypothetical protein